MNDSKKCLFFIVIPALILLGISTRAISQIDNFLKVHIVDYSGGQVSKNYPDELTNNQGALIQNAIINVKGQLSTRLGQQLFNQDTQSAAFGGIGRFDYQNGSGETSYMMIASAPKVSSSLINSSLWTVVNNGLGITVGKQVEFTQANNQVFAYDGYDATGWWNNSTWTTSMGYPGSAPVVSTASWLSTYMFMAGNPTNPQYVYFSNATDPLTYPAQNVVNVTVGDGQPIEKIQAYRTGDLIIYKTRSIYDLNIVSNGNTTCTPQPACTWTLTALTQDTGTYSPRSVVSLGNDQWFLSGPPFGVRSVIRSQFDKTFVNLVSQPIQDIFDGTNINGQVLNTLEVQNAAAVYFDNKYILAIPVAGSNVNNLVVVYDFITQSWYEITGWYPEEWLVYNNSLYYADANDGRVVQCFFGTQGDIGTQVPAYASGPSVGIDTVYVSKMFDFDDPEDPKTLDNLLLEFTPTGNYTATVSVNLDNTGWQVAGTIALKSQALTLPFNLPANLASSGLTYGVLQLTKFGKFWKMQVKVELNGTNQQISLQKISMYATKLTWERERN